MRFSVPPFLVLVLKELHISVDVLPASDGRTVFAYQKGKPIPSILVNVAGKEIETHLDSGSGGGLSLPKQFAKTLPPKGPATESKKKARSVRGDWPFLMASSPSEHLLTTSRRLSSATWFAVATSERES